MRNATLLVALPLLFTACATGSGGGEALSPGEPFALNTGQLEAGPRLLGCSARRAQSADGRLDMNDPDDRKVLANGKSMQVTYGVSRDGAVVKAFVTRVPGMSDDVWNHTPEDEARAVAYVKTCTFEPGLRAGEPVAVKDLVMSVFVATR